MGLDMYLSKAKRIGEVTAEDITVAEEYMEYLLRPSKYKESSLYDWCHIRDDKVKIEVVDNYLSEFKTRYGAWDKEKRWGFLGLWDGIAYWRKANQIHRWFVENVQNGEDDCGYYEVKKEDLESLLDTCKEVVDASVLVEGKIKNGKTYEDGKWIDVIEDGKVIEDPSVAMELLPAQEGFFFGNYEYDEYYLSDVLYTIDVIEKIVKETDFDKEIIKYHASW